MSPPPVSSPVAPRTRHEPAARLDPVDGPLAGTPRGKRPSIAFLGSRGIPARYGGFETFVQEVSVRLVELGHDVTVFCERGSAPGPSVFRGVRLEYRRAWAPGPLRTLQFDASCLFATARRFDVVYMLGYGASALCSLPRVLGKQVWINMDGLEWRRSKWGVCARAWLRTMERAAFSSASCLVFDGAQLREEVEGRRGRARRSTVIEYGAEVYERDDELEPLTEFELAPGGYDLAVCRPEPENHLLEIVRAHAAARTRRPLVLVGDLARATRYALSVRRAAAPETRILGPVYDPRALRPLRRHAHAYLHGHSVGGTNPSLVEAMGCGSLVLAHDNPFNRETLDGAGVFWRDGAELAGVLRESAELPAETRADLRRRCVERVRQRYDWSRIAAAYARLIEDSLA